MARSLLQPLLVEAESRGLTLRETPELLTRALTSARSLLAPWQTR
jgi:hypothetical protein